MGLLSCAQSSSRNENFASTSKNLLETINWTFPVMRYLHENSNILRSIVGSTVQLKLGILIFWTSFPQKGYFRSKTKKSDHHLWILHIRIIWGTKLELKLTILIFWSRFTQKGSRYKTEKVNITIEFWIFKFD